MSNITESGNVTIAGTITSTNDIVTTGNVICESIIARTITINPPNIIGNIECDNLTCQNTLTTNSLTCTTANCTTLTVETVNAQFYGNVSSTQIGYLSGLTSNVQTQMNNFAPKNNPTFTGTITADNMIIPTIRLNNQNLNTTLTLGTGDYNIALPLPSIIHVISSGVKIFLPSTTDVYNGTTILIKNSTGLLSSLYGAYNTTDAKIWTTAGSTAVALVAIASSGTARLFYRDGYWYMY